MRLPYILKQLKDLSNRLNKAGYPTKIVSIKSDKETSLQCEFGEDSSGELFSLPVSRTDDLDDNLIPRGYETYGLAAYGQIWAVDDDGDDFMWASAKESEFRHAGVKIQYIS